MPIFHNAELRRIPQDVFSSIDYEVMGAAFAAHNELGRLFDESHYAAYMDKRLLESGHQVEREFKISLIYKDFKKDYYVDLLVDSSVPYELKTVKALNDEHRAQALNYLYLCNLSHGKLINFRKPSVEGEFISTSIAQPQRFEYAIDMAEWSECSTQPILPTLEELLNEWGAYLSLEVYREGLAHFCCPLASRSKPASLRTRSGFVGKVYLNRINESNFLYISSTNKYQNDHKKHLFNQLEMTELKRAQWINFDRNRITLRSITAN